MDNLQNPILVIDETLREGMQFQGLVFSLSQRKQILEFQDALGVDICQAGYPPAHAWEAEQVRALCDHTQCKGFSTRIAGMGRAFSRDVSALLSTGIRDFHLHSHIRQDASSGEEDRIFGDMAETLADLRAKNPLAVISLAMLDIGRTTQEKLQEHAKRAIRDLKVDILSLPDTSGVLAPNRLFDLIRPIAAAASSYETRISVHCHNDMGMASANTVMGVCAGARVMEASVLGIGERNGLADLFTTARILKDQGFSMRLKTDDIDGFREYYTFVNAIVKEQTGEDLLTYTTPVFGQAVTTHVAGTHGSSFFGISKEETYYLNLLCGRHLVKKHLDASGIAYRPDRLSAITEAVKTLSARMGRRLTLPEINAIATDHSRDLP
ncbi:MAG: hypothetical protein V1793_14780 [Pseudomonadota bacterium]